MVHLRSSKLLKIFCQAGRYKFLIVKKRSKIELHCLSGNNYLLSGYKLLSLLLTEHLYKSIGEEHMFRIKNNNFMFYILIEKN
jgi:hypothetical protein